MIKRNLYGLTQNDMEEIRSIIQKFPLIEEVILFGSRAKGTYYQGSDVDLALKGRIDHHTIYKISDLLNEESTMPYNFDIIAYDNIESKNLKKHIERVGATPFSHITSVS